MKAAIYQKFVLYLMQRFELIKKIGTGAYSEVFKAWDYVTNTHVAIKQINHSNSDTRVILNREIRILKKFNHPNIVKLLGCYNDKCYTYLILEYLPYDLITYYKQLWRDHKRRLSDRQITLIFHQVCEAIGYMHNNFNIMHRDVKPENVLIDPTTFSIKMIDFGFATEMNFYKKNTEYMVTRWYRPLQIVLNLPYDMKIDIFSLGALLLELYKGEQVFKSSSSIDQLYWIYEICGFPNWEPALAKMKQLGITLNPSKKPAIFEITKNYRPQASNLIIGMLQPVPYARYSIQDVLNHQYFIEFNQNKRRITSQHSYTSANHSSLNISVSNHHSFNVNFDSSGEISNRHNAVHSDRQHNYSNSSNFNQSSDRNFQPPRRKSQMDNPSHNRPNHKSQPSLPQRVSIDKRYARDWNVHNFEQQQKIAHKQQTRETRERLPIFQIPHNQNQNPNIQKQEQKRQNRTRSLKIEVTSLKKNPTFNSQHQYYTPKNGIPIRNQKDEKPIVNNETQKKAAPLKIRPNLNTVKKDPTFCKLRNKGEHHVKIHHKAKISLSNKFMIPSGFEQKQNQVRNHIGLQIHR